MIHDSSLNEKHDCNDVTINSINVNYVDDMQSYKLRDDHFVMYTTYFNDHDWGDNDSFDLHNLFKSHVEYACNNTKSGFGRASTLGKNNPTYLESVQSYDFF